MIITLEISAERVAECEKFVRDCRYPVNAVLLGMARGFELGSTEKVEMSDLEIMDALDAAGVPPAKRTHHEEVRMARAVIAAYEAKRGEK